MTGMDFDQKIRSLKQQLRKDESFLQQYEDAFKEEVVKHLRQWWWETAARFVQRNPEKTTEHGPQGIAALKARVADLRVRAEAVVDEIFDDPDVWWHRKPRSKRNVLERYHARSERVGPKKLDAALRVAMGAVAPILRDFGYIDPEQYDARWLEWDEAGEHHPPGARPHYPYTIDWPAEMIKKARFYDGRLQQAANKMRDIALIQRQKEARATESIWDAS
ncbi:MAG: hypothetical protein AAFV53_12540 [Myxococcota bacterium]